MIKIDVCKDCQDRYPACWGSCPKYIEARKKLDEQKAARCSERKREIAVKGCQYYGLTKTKKKKGKQI